MELTEIKVNKIDCGEEGRGKERERGVAQVVSSGSWKVYTG